MGAKIDLLEKGGRFVLWIAIAVAFVFGTVEVYARDKQLAKDTEELRAEHTREKAELVKAHAAEVEAKKPLRLTLASMGPGMRALVGSEGLLWFTNATPREGVVCVYGVASTTNGQSVESLPSCAHVEPYESNMKVSMMFAGGDLRAICPTPSACDLSVKDLPISEPAPAPVAAAR